MFSFRWHLEKAMEEFLSQTFRVGVLVTKNMHSMDCKVPLHDLMLKGDVGIAKVRH